MIKLLKVLLKIITYSSYIKKLLDEVAQEKINKKITEQNDAFEKANRGEPQ